MSNSSKVYDVCIIGASIAGNYLAYLLSRTGLNILLIEEHKEIGLPLQCAGIVSKKLTQLIDVPKEIILNRVKTVKIFSPSGRSIELSGDEKPYIIDRVALDRLFYNKNHFKQNIKYLLDEKFKSFSYYERNNQNLVQIETNKRIISSKVLVGCDGPNSTVGKQLGIQNNNIYASQIRIYGKFDENKAYLYFDPRWKELFGWIVPEGNSIYRIGIASAFDLSKKFKIFLNQLNIKVKEKISQQGGIIPRGKMNRIAFDNILLLGDSACHVKVTTGGGIIMLLIASKFAAQCISYCFKRKDFSRKLIKRYYEKPCARSIGKQLKINYLIRLFFENFEPDDFDELFKIIKTTKIEKKISLYGDMDFPLNLILKLVKNITFLKFTLRILKKNPRLINKVIQSYFFRSI